VRVEASESGTGSSNYVPQLHSATTPTLIGAAKGAVTVNGTTKVISTNGAIGDLWSATLTPAIVNDAGFGVSIWSTDTINTLAVDFITIAITWTDVPNAWDARQYFRRRRNVTRRKLRTVIPVPQTTTTAPSVDRDMDSTPPFVTKTIRSRRSLSIGWMSALTAQTQAPAVPAVSAWLAPVVRRRRETVRRLVVVDHAAIERYTPPSIAWVDLPRVIRVEFRRRLQPQAPQLLFPPPTGPPVEPSWAARRLPATSQHRQLLKVPEHPSYPQTPATPSDDSALDETFVTRTHRSRRALRLPELVIPTAPQVSQAPLPAWQEQRATYRPSERTLRTVPDHAVYPPTPPIYPSFVPSGFNRRRETERTLQSAGPQPEWPATPAVAGQPITAVVPTVRKRRKHRQGLFLSAGSVVEARVQPQYPSYATAPPKKRRSIERTLLRAPGLPSTPASPAVPAQPVTAWQQPKQHWIERARELQRAAPQITYPATPPVPPQPLPAWAAPAMFHVEHRRTLRRSLPLNTYPATPGQPPSAWRAVAANRIERRRTLRTAAHAPSYRPTPAPPQPVTALVLGGFHRRHGWRKLRIPLELDDFMVTPPAAVPGLQPPHYVIGRMSAIGLGVKAPISLAGITVDGRMAPTHAVDGSLDPSEGHGGSVL
jgi:hypothetical protein